MDAYEFTCALALMSEGTLSERCQLIFDLYDFDQSGQISMDELSCLLTNGLTALNAMLDLPKPNIDEIDKASEDLFHQIDSDKSGSVTRQEFL